MKDIVTRTVSSINCCWMWYMLFLIFSLGKCNISRITHGLLCDILLRNALQHASGALIFWEPIYFCTSSWSLTLTSLFFCFHLSVSLLSLISIFKLIFYGSNWEHMSTLIGAWFLLLKFNYKEKPKSYIKKKWEKFANFWLNMSNLYLLVFVDCNLYLLVSLTVKRLCINIVSSFINIFFWTLERTSILCSLTCIHGAFGLYIPHGPCTNYICVSWLGNSARTKLWFVSLSTTSNKWTWGGPVIVTFLLLLLHTSFSKYVLWKKYNKLIFLIFCLAGYLLIIHSIIYEALFQ